MLQKFCQNWYEIVRNKLYENYLGADWGVHVDADVVHVHLSKQMSYSRNKGTLKKSYIF